MTAPEESLFIPAPDGLKLHVRVFGDAHARGLPVVCLPGLTRTTEDFRVLAETLVGQGKRIFALDYRGRGLSDYDEPSHYTLAVELADINVVLAALNIAPALFIGTSRGGILTMLLAATRPAAIAGAVLNDIGPVIEPSGLMRIKSYVGKLPPPRSFEDGAVLLQRTSGGQFPKLTAQDWLAAAKRAWRMRDGGLVPTYDARIAETLATVDLNQPLPTMWEQFDALVGVPTMVIRGANSDLLSAETLQAMKDRHPGLHVLEVADQGHAPLLAEPDVIARIEVFVAHCELSSRRG